MKSTQFPQKKAEKEETENKIQMEQIRNKQQDELTYVNNHIKSKWSIYPN